VTHSTFRLGFLDDIRWGRVSEKDITEKKLGEKRKEGMQMLTDPG